jgi:hypothetical protein
VLLDACTFIRWFGRLKNVRFLQFLLSKLEVSAHNILVPVPQYHGTMVPSGTVSLVPSIFTPLDQGGPTVTKNDHCKTCTVFMSKKNNGRFVTSMKFDAPS